MERRTRRTYKKSAVTRQTILEAALALMKEKGYQGTTIREICARAGTAVGSFYSYFGGKTDILRALYADGDAYFATVVRAETSGPDTGEALRRFVAHYARLNVRTGVETVRVMYTPDNEWFARRKSQQEVLEEVIRKAAVCGAAAPAIPVTDTVKRARDGVVEETLDRETLFAVQTPQVFEASLLKAALQKAAEDGVTLTDDCAAVERLGMQVSLTRGDRANLKLTTPTDLDFGLGILIGRGEA